MAKVRNLEDVKVMWCNVKLLRRNHFKMHGIMINSIYISVCKLNKYLFVFKCLSGYSSGFTWRVCPPPGSGRRTPRRPGTRPQGSWCRTRWACPRGAGARCPRGGGTSADSPAAQGWTWARKYQVRIKRRYWFSILWQSRWLSYHCHITVYIPCPMHCVEQWSLQWQNILPKRGLSHSDFYGKP